MRQGKVCRIPAIHLFDSFDEFKKVVLDADRMLLPVLRKSHGWCGKLTPMEQFLNSERWERAADGQREVVSTLQHSEEMVSGRCEAGSQAADVEAVAHQTTSFKSKAHFILPLLRLVAHPYTEDTLLSLLVGISTRVLFEEDLELQSCSAEATPHALRFCIFSDG